MSMNSCISLCVGGSKHCTIVPYSLNISRGKIFADFVVYLTVKNLTSKYLSKHTFRLRNALSPQKIYPEIRKSGSTAKICIMYRRGLLTKELRLLQQRTSELLCYLDNIARLVADGPAFNRFTHSL